MAAALPSADVAFATNLTPGNYDSANVQLSGDVQTFPANFPLHFVNSETGEVVKADGAQVVPTPRPPRRKRRSQSPDHVPRPPNAFILFRVDFVKNGRLLGNMENHSNLSKMAAESWRTLPPQKRAYWDAQALLERRAHRLQYPDYHFQPTPGQPKKPRPPPKPKLRHMSVPYHELPPDTPPVDKPPAPSGYPRDANQFQRKLMDQPSMIAVYGLKGADMEQRLQEMNNVRQTQVYYPPVPPPCDPHTGKLGDQDCNAFDESDFDYYYSRMVSNGPQTSMSATPEEQTMPPPPNADVEMSEPSEETGPSAVQLLTAKQEEESVPIPPAPAAAPEPKRYLARARDAAFPYSYVAEAQLEGDTGFEHVSPIYRRLMESQPATLVTAM
ncbi:hypothetical protein BD626DRAFT_513234 [Schizophyllum amplum]|uniref:HMG box domain-containing protein n=1 Tax=Schizophyllum amplum TaxID=97359 RepID=A0A550BZB3_9AGAR|nr:hypothetical protein BD626DRAFT_513234 [Auriculariopsis ampla]